MQQNANRLSLVYFGLACCLLLGGPTLGRADHIFDLQSAAIRNGHSPAAHWGYDPDDYTLWKTHSNRLIPVYTYGTLNAGKGVDLNSYTGENSLYRNAERLRELYGRVPPHTVNPTAEYLDQTDLAALQRAGFAAGKRHVFLVVFDGMDWDTTRAAAIHNTQSVPYTSGRGRGTHFQEYTAGGTSQYGFMVTSPHNDGTKTNVDNQTVLNPGGTLRGGYNPQLGGATPWDKPTDKRYLIAKSEDAAMRHAYTDSSSSATSMTVGAKIYNNSVNVDATGNQLTTIAYEVQQQGYAVGAVTSVPISHATPAAAYAHNVYRNDYQDLTRDLLGLPSIAHPQTPLSGLDVIIGGGYGAVAKTDEAQGANFIPGNVFLADHDLQAIDARQGGKYTVAIRQSGVDGTKAIQKAAQSAAKSGTRLFGFYGVGSVKGHLPYATADGDYRPAPDHTGKSEEYSAADLTENPTLAEMTQAALTVLARKPKGFWLMVEPGDVDWANHQDNLDNSIGAVNSGDAAVRVITDWVEKNSNWEESLMIVTADHGHYLVLDRPALLIAPENRASAKK